MRTIKKGNHPAYHLEKRHQSQPVPQNPDRAWHHFSHKEEIRHFLRQEQYYLCAYCEISLNELDQHIEHLKPKSTYPQDTFDYNNLVLSCFSSSTVNQYSQADRSCGYYKGNQYEPSRFVSPLDPDCQRFFYYNLVGEVEPNSSLNPKERIQAQYTIDLLNLNNPRLVRQRLDLIMETNQIIVELSDDLSILRGFIEMDLCSINGRLQGFHSTRLQQFGQLGQEVIQELQ